MKYCSLCGADILRAVPPGEDRERHVCRTCDTVHYENPRNVVGCLIEEGDRLLLCRRAIEPAHGRWTPPAGFLELGESLIEGAVRETWEEARARVEVLAPHSFLDLPHIGQCHVFYRARLAAPAFEPGPESLEVRWFTRNELPWDELAFPVTRTCLELWARDRGAGVAHVHHGVVRWLGSGSRFDPAQYELQGHLACPLA